MKQQVQIRFGIILCTIMLLVLAACGTPVAEEPAAAEPAAAEPAAAELKADAGADLTVNVGDSPEFSGCASTGAIANYQWTIVKAPENMPEYNDKVIREVDADCSYTLEASMIADEVGMWEIELEVTDGDGNSSSDTVAIEVVE